MLVVMEHRNVHAFGQLLLNVEALGRLDVFEVDAAQRGLKRSNDFNQFVGVVFCQFDVEHIHPGKFLEQATLAFHHRLAGQRADVAQAQHGGAVGDHAHQVAARGVLVGHQRVGLDVQARVGNARRIGQRQVTLVGQWFGGCDRNLALVGAAVVFQRGFAQGLFGRGKGLVHKKLLKTGTQKGTGTGTEKRNCGRVQGLSGSAISCLRSVPQHGMKCTHANKVRSINARR